VDASLEITPWSEGRRELARKATRSDPAERGRRVERGPQRACAQGDALRSELARKATPACEGATARRDSGVGA